MYRFFQRLFGKLFYRVFWHIKSVGFKWPRSQSYPYDLLQHWNQSEWPEYQRWIDKYSLQTPADWLELYLQAKVARSSPTFTIVTPVYNTDKRILSECLLSVKMQTNPFWELILVNDASSKEETLSTLNSAICQDPRIRVLDTGTPSPSGISIATNLAIEQASGDYIIFLDHDDRLAPEAIHFLSQALEESPELDILYSDRDMISPADKRFMHLMKPDWSPENLLSGNYIFHLMCYRKTLIKAVGGLHPEYDGSQDYDLILRCMEYQPKVRHIKRVLYHWRQHVQSVAMNVDSKSYAFDAGIRALEEAMKRRGISATVSEIKSLWRGNYRIQLPLPDKKTIGWIVLDKTLPANQYSATILSHPVLKESQPYMMFCSAAYTEQSSQTGALLASWLELEDVGMACGKLLDLEDRIVYAGMFYGSDGQLVRPYCGYPATEAGYMAVTSIVRNISLPNPFCVVIKRELWQQLGGFSDCYQGPHALLDFAFRAQQAGWRVVFDPQAIYCCADGSGLDIFVQTDADRFHQQWQEKLLAGDPYYSPNLSQQSISYELNLN